jgi:hypothetical protein
MKIKILPILIILSLFLAGVNVIALEDVQEDKNTIQLAKEEESLSFSSATIKQKGEFVELNVAEANTVLRVTGKPMIPSKTQTFTFPRGTKIKDVKCTISDVTTQVIPGKIEPTPKIQKRISLVNTIKQENNENIVEEVKTVESKDVYSSSDLYPDNWYDYKIYSGLVDGEPSVILKVNSYPVRYSPADDTIHTIDSLDVEVTYEKPVNPQPRDKKYDLLIITPRRFRLSLQRLVSHKKRMGVNTTIKTVESINLQYLIKGRDKPERIKYFIRDAEQNWSIKYVLLVGGLKNHLYANDREHQNYGSRWWYVPVRYANLAGGYISDLYYADLYKGEGEFEDWDSNGDGIFAELFDELDLWPDVYYGRLPCRNIIEVRSIVNKIIKYEKSSHWNEKWFKRMIAAGGVTYEFLEGPEYEGKEGDGEWLCNISLDNMKDHIDNPIKLYASHKFTSMGGIPDPLNITREWSKGAGFVLLQGHGSAVAWDTSYNDREPPRPDDLVGGLWAMDFPRIKNKEKLPIVVVGGCHNGMFRITRIKSMFDFIRKLKGEHSIYNAYGWPVGSCYSWKLVQKRSGGAIACTGCTDAGTGRKGDPLNLSARLESNFFYKVGIDNVTTLGEAHSGSIEKYMTDVNVNDNSAHYFCITQYQLFGDPSLKIGGKSETVTKEI